MAPRNWKWTVIACVLVIASYRVGRYAGDNSRELAFQKEKEETRKSEFAKLVKIQEEEKRVAERRRIEEKIEERHKEAMKSLDESGDRQAALLMKYFDTIQNNR